MPQLMTTKEVAGFLNINEKMVYTLISEKGLPATKITGKWLFPKHLVEQWVDNGTVNYPGTETALPPYEGLIIIAGSNDFLLEKAIAHFNTTCSGHVAVFGNIGSMGGLQALRRKRCHIATSHLIQEDDSEYNFDYVAKELKTMPAIINFCQRQQGILVARNNPHNIENACDLAGSDIKIINRPLGTGTRLLLDRELKKAGLNHEKINGYNNTVHNHLNVGLEILNGHADAGPGIKVVASVLGLDFIPLRWERYDFLISKERFFDEGVQKFLSMLQDSNFKKLSAELSGYDLKLSGKMMFAGEASSLTA
jgi:putative molybdopterin biosynthesis protein